MERITPKLTRIFVVALLFATALTTANSQESTRTTDYDALAARGETLANGDPLAIELRNQQPNDSARRAFDIGMGVADGNTAPGPGKDRVCALQLRGEAQACSVAVLFSVERNRNAELAATGARIARSNERIAAARNAEPDEMYRQGFDIATGIFGDPKRGARGDTARGPGSLGIRDTLTAAGQRGFNASVTLHLSRNYKPTSASITVPDAVGTNPGTVYTADQTQRTVNVDWNAGSDYTDCEIDLSVDNGRWSKFAASCDGTKPATIQLGSSHTFRMMVYDGQEGPPKMIKTLTVIGEQGNPPPPADGSGATQPNGTSGTAIPGSATSEDPLAATGAAIASEDPLATELRDRHPEGPARRGFDIGMAAAEGHTLPGPGKERIRESLRLDQQGGDVAARSFDTAVSFSLERNKNAKLASTGAAIAELDQTVADARSAEPDVFYRLGFDDLRSCSAGPCAKLPRRARPRSQVPRVDSP